MVGSFLGRKYLSSFELLINSVGMKVYAVKHRPIALYVSANWTTIGQKEKKNKTKNALVQLTSIRFTAVIKFLLVQ